MRGEYLVYSLISRLMVHRSSTDRSWEVFMGL